MISNRPKAIRQFIERHDEVIYKPLRGDLRQKRTRYSTYTTRVRIEDFAIGCDNNGHPQIRIFPQDFGRFSD